MCTQVLFVCVGDLLNFTGSFSDCMLHQSHSSVFLNDFILSAISSDTPDTCIILIKYYSFFYLS